MAAVALSAGPGPWSPPPPASPVPLPRFAGEDPCRRRQRLDPPLFEERGRGTTRSVVEGATTIARVFAAIAAGLPQPAWGHGSVLNQGGRAVRRVRRAWTRPLALAASPEGEFARTLRRHEAGFVAIHIPVRGSFIHLAPR